VVRAASLLMVGPVIDHSGLILCGVATVIAAVLALAMWWRPGCSGVGLASQQKGIVTCTYTSCSIKRTKDQRVLRTTLLSLAHLPSHGLPGQNFCASNCLFSVPWPGGRTCHVGSVGLR